MLLSRSQTRKDSRSETDRVVGVYRNTERVGEAFRTPGRKPAYSSKGGEAGAERRRLERDNRGGSRMQALHGNYNRCSRAADVANPLCCVDQYICPEQEMSPQDPSRSQGPQTDLPRNTRKSTQEGNPRDKPPSSQILWNEAC